MTKSDEETLDYIGDFGFHSGFAGFGGAFSSDYMPLSLCNSAFSSFSELSDILTATAMNGIRLFVWFEGVPLAKTRVSSFAKLAPD